MEMRIFMCRVSIKMARIPVSACNGFLVALGNAVTRSLRTEAQASQQRPDVGVCVPYGEM